jgi:hypothetical protein
MCVVKVMEVRPGVSCLQGRTVVLPGGHDRGGPPHCPGGHPGRQSAPGDRRPPPIPPLDIQVNEEIFAALSSNSQLLHNL